MIDPQGITEVGVGGAVVYGVLRLVFGFLTEKEARRSSDLDAVRQELSILASTVRADIAALLQLVKVQQDREQRFSDRDWPALIASVKSCERRIAHVERDVATMRGHLGLLDGLTPPQGISCGVPDQEM